MVLKRQLRQKGDEDCSDPAKRRRICKGLNYGRTLQESVSYLEPMIRKWVQEAVERSLEKNLRPSYDHDQVDSSGSRNLQLLFDSSLPHTLFTGNKIMSRNESPVKLVMYDSNSNEIITCGPLSSLKVTIVVVDGDFGAANDWTKEEFDSKIVMNREGKRPLVTGQVKLTLQGGVGYLSDLIFTDNSSWIRSGRFRLGAKVHTNSDQVDIREAMSTPFKVKDHRGESYKKHYPPSLDDQVWRLEKIARDGPSHKKLTLSGIFSVGDFLRLYATDKYQLRKILQVSNKTWETIFRHATTCSLDDKKYVFRTATGTGLFFNSIYNVIGVTFDGQDYHSMESLNPYQLRVVEELKQHAYKNINEWVSVCDPVIVGYPMLVATTSPDSFTNPNVDLHGINFQELDAPPPYNCLFEVGESSNSMECFNNSPTLTNCFGMSSDYYCPDGGLYIDNYVAGGSESHLSTDDLPIDDGFQVESSSSALQGNNYNGLFVASFVNGGISDRISKTSGCKFVLLVKTRRLGRRNLAARPWLRSPRLTFASLCA
ncbi:hypothetical protein MIMGU_mgv1a024444mg [Erythranthe guttata]|uniref:Calmodulin-binding protein n=1 Tax=Erythranthe guttata TaxID=4155 RepID=A0A022QED5_ERYGU|nr:hypothetical protein MIMGU_mgv1a024444mg [Erythranthe guttata]